MNIGDQQHSVYHDQISVNKLKEENVERHHEIKTSIKSYILTFLSKKEKTS